MSKLLIRNTKPSTALPHMEKMNLDTHPQPSSFFSGNAMSGTMRRLRSGDLPTHTSCAYLDGGCVGWVATFRDGECHLFVSPAARRLGVATSLMGKAQKDHPLVGFCPWDNGSVALFTRRSDTPIHPAWTWALRS